MDGALYRIAGSADNEVVILTGHLGLNATGGVSSTYTHFNRGTFTKAATGLYTLTLKDKFAKILSVQLSMIKKTEADIYVELGDVDGRNGEDAGQAIAIRTVKRSDGTAIDNTTETRSIEVTVFAKNSIVDR